jgi:hypothetical protein
MVFLKRRIVVPERKKFVPESKIVFREQKIYTVFGQPGSVKNFV